VNSQHYEHAAGLYAAKDWVGALGEYYACLKEDISKFDPGDIGMVYYRLGNCLLHNKNYPEAIDAYAKSLEDNQFLHHTAVLANMGKAQLGAGQDDAAIASFQQVVADKNYARRYKINIALGAAFRKKGDVAKAGNAYRDAAFDPKNAQPTFALQKLAECFIDFGRPQNAAQTYQTILKINTDPKVLGDTYAKLGQAYVKIAHYQEAVAAFKKADANQHELTPEEITAYTKAEDMLNANAFALAHVDDIREQAKQETQTIATVQKNSDDLHPENVDNLGREDWTSDLSEQMRSAQAGGKSGRQPSSEDYSVTDLRGGRGFDMDEGKKHGAGRIILRIILVILILAIIVLGAGIFCYVNHIGLPNQQAQAEALFNDNASGQSTYSLWQNGDSTDEQATIDTTMQAVAQTDNINIVSMESTLDTSTAIVEATLPQGGTMNYQVGFVRSGLGYKINKVQLYFASTAA
jgi:tetratricopeptide (TPR) repeat protein/Tfp pilus assembly protein PilE